MADPDEEIAASLDATPELLRFLPALLQDVPALGCSVDPILRMLKDVGVGAGHRVLDLACGKGAVGLRLAQELSCRVVGMDLFEPFIQEARARATDMGLEGRCKFRVDDLRRALDTKEPFDVVVYSGVDSLGALHSCVSALRRAVVEQGYMVIDDGFLRAGAVPGPGYGHYCEREEARRRLTAHGDRILAEEVVSGEELHAFNEATTEAIRVRAKELAALHPEHAELILAYVRRQEVECATLEADFVGAVWLLQKTASC